MRRLVLAWVLLAGALSPGVAQTAVTLDDFEGELKGWPAAAAVTADASQGKQALSWTTVATTAPQSLRFSYGDRQVEMCRWDRLRFDYKVVGTDCTWWGVKITDAPLADGMQATWQLGDKASLTPGKWQSAVVAVQHPTYLWGEGPDLTSQRIDFRVQLETGQPVTILLDNLRLERDPFHVGKVAAADPVREGEWVSREVAVELANAMDTPVRVGVSLAETAAWLVATCEPQTLDLAAEASGTVRVTLRARVSGPGAATPLTTLSTQLVAKGAGMDTPAEMTKLELAVSLGEPVHPSLLVTREIAAAALERAKTDPDAQAAYETLKAAADGWLTRAPEFPDRGGQWWHWYTCKACGARLTNKTPTEHVCPDCGASYTGWPYDDVVLDTIHGSLARAIRDCGLMYVFSGETAYAAKAREILLGYAERYLSYPLHDINGEPKKGGGHVGPQTLDEATWLIPVAQGFDCIYETLSEEDRKAIADKLLLPAAWLIHDHQWGIHNICCWHDSAYGLVGLTLGEARLASDAIAGPKGFRAQVEKGVNGEGQWYEGAWGYHYYTMMALHPLAIAARNAGVDLYSERYRGMYTVPLQFMAPGGMLPAFNDSTTAYALGNAAMYEVAYARWQDPMLLLPVVEQGPRRSLEALLYGAPAGAAPDFRLGSQVFAEGGYVILRSGPTGARGAEARIPENYLALDWGLTGAGTGTRTSWGSCSTGSGRCWGRTPGALPTATRPTRAGTDRR